MNGFWNRDGKDDLGGELGSGPTPPDELVRNISRRVQQERPRRRISPRLTGGSALAAAAVLGLGVTGGLGAAANGVANTAKAVFAPAPSNGKNVHVENVASAALNQYGNNIKVGVCHLAGGKYTYILVSVKSSLTLGRSTRDIVSVASGAFCPTTGGTAKINTTPDNHFIGAIKLGTVTVALTVPAYNYVRSYELIGTRGSSQVRIRGTIGKLQKNLTKSFTIGGKGKVTVSLKIWTAGGAVAIRQIKI